MEICWRATTPTMDPVQHVWKREGSSQKAFSFREGLPYATDDFLTLIRCTCESNAPCRTKWCGCSKFNIYVDYCACLGDNGFFKEKVREHPVKKIILMRILACVNLVKSIRIKHFPNKIHQVSVFNSILNNC